MGFDESTAFETWLFVERRRLSAASEALLHENALSAPGLRAGRRGGRRGQPAGVDEPPRRELPVPAGPLARRVRAARGRPGAGGPLRAPVPPRARDASPRPRSGPQPTPGSAAPPDRPPSVGRPRPPSSRRVRPRSSAGAVDAGLECLRRAVAEADAVERRAAADAGDDRARRAPSCTAREAATRRARRCCTRLSPRRTASATRWPRRRRPASWAFIDVQAGRRERADRLAGGPQALAADDDEELAAVLGRARDEPVRHGALPGGAGRRWRRRSSAPARPARAPGRLVGLAGRADPPAAR